MDVVSWDLHGASPDASFNAAMDTTEHASFENELGAMTQIARALEPLDAELRGRVLRWVMERYASGADLAPAPDHRASIPPRRAGGAPARAAMSPSETQDVGARLGQYRDVGDAFSDSGPPTTMIEKALVVAAYIQSKDAPEGFVSRPVQAALKDLGHPATNITNVFASLMNRRPQLVTQVRKSGTSNQARKTYRVTKEGMAVVGRLLASRAEAAVEGADSESG